MVRKDMIDNSVGYRGFTIGEAFTGPSRMNDGVKQTVEDVSTLILGKNAYKVLKKAEQGLQSAVSVAKSTIVIRSVIIPVANFSSNVIQLLSYNISPRDIYKGYKEKLVEIETFIKAEKRLRQIESQFETYTDVNKLKGLKAEKDSLEDMISGLSIAPLLEAGMFSSISEGMSEIDSSIVKSEWADKLEAAIDAVPRKLGTVGRYVGMTQDSEIFKLLARATMYGDFLGKSILRSCTTCSGLVPGLSHSLANPSERSGAASIQFCPPKATNAIWRQSPVSVSRKTIVILLPAPPCRTRHPGSAGLRSAPEFGFWRISVSRSST